MEILFGIIVLCVWLTIILEILVIGFIVVLYLSFYLLGIIYLIVSKLFSVDFKKIFSFVKKFFNIDFTSKLYKANDYLKKMNKKLEIRLKKLDRQMILRAKNTKIYLISGIIMSIIALFSFIIFIMSVYYNDYLVSFLFLGLIAEFFGIYYLKVHKRFHK